ncbi:MAG: hypothetical protein F9K22_09005 [Bacteroidetes bacterium]|nr:MAG: hypothetical protein F9K22_09005 [Bacteroidota bacterium]
MNTLLARLSTTAVIVLLLTVSATMSSCKKPVETPVISEWDTHQDPISGLEVEFPKGWLKNVDPKAVKLYSTQAVSQKFYELYSTGTTDVNDEEGGVELTIAMESFADAQAGTLDAYKEQQLKAYEALGLADEKPVQVGKETGAGFSYSVKVSKNTTMSGRKIFAVHDSVFYTVSVTGFNDYTKAYEPVFDRMIASIKLPKPKETYKDPNAASKPSPDLTKFSNEFVEFMHPDNFTAAPAAAKGGAVHSLHLEGLRKDCTIDLDIFPTKTDKGEVKFDRFVEDNKAKFSPKSVTAGKVDGLDAKVLAASPAPQIDRKVFFVAKGERIYRIILTWYKPMAADFQPAFESVVASMKLK